MVFSSCKQLDELIQHAVWPKKLIVSSHEPNNSLLQRVLYIHSKLDWKLYVMLPDYHRLVVLVEDEVDEGLYAMHGSKWFHK